MSSLRINYDEVICLSKALKQSANKTLRSYSSTGGWTRLSPRARWELNQNPFILKIQSGPKFFLFVDTVLSKTYLLLCICKSGKKYFFDSHKSFPGKDYRTKVEKRITFLFFDFWKKTWTICAYVSFSFPNLHNFKIQTITERERENTHNLDE